jgi:hypothetical protein
MSGVLVVSGVGGVSGVGVPVSRLLGVLGIPRLGGNVAFRRVITVPVVQMLVVLACHVRYSERGRGRSG